jgi:hypothetical protein
MARSLCLAWTDPVSPEVDVEFDHWYENVHLPEVRQAVPSISHVSRYRMAEPNGAITSARPQHRYLAVYEMDSEDIAGAEAALQSAISGGDIVLSPLLDLERNPPAIEWYRHV